MYKIRKKIGFKGVTDKFLIFEANINQFQNCFMILKS